MEWVDIEGYEGYYRINKLGQVMRVDSGKILKPGVGKVGYPVVSLWKNNKGTTKMVHRLLAQCFIPNPENKMEVNHIDGVKTNNDLSNLEWVTSSENSFHAHRIGLNNMTKEGRERLVKAVKERNVGNSYRSKEVMRFDSKGNLLKEYGSAMAASIDVGISFSMVCALCRGTKNSKKWFFKYKEEIENGNN